MGLTSTLYTGISGLQANSEAMSVTGNNISNSNTIGFKSSSTLFSDVLSASISSASGDSQVGRGTQIATVQTSFSQGSFQSTSNSTDLAIEGDGFFMVSEADSSETLYTRNGSLSFDADGYLVNSEGYRVQGKSFDANDELVGGDPSDIQVNINNQIPAQQTGSLTLTTNLDADSSVVGPFDISDPDSTSNYSTSTQIYDSLGNTHLATTYFSMTADQSWEWHTAVDSSELDTSVAGVDALTEIGSGTLSFDSSGNLVTGSTAVTTAGSLVWNNGSDATQQIDMTFNTTQYSSNSVVISQSQDGYAPGEVVQVNIDNSGTVTASYSNGASIDVAMLTLATFTNASGLSKEGGSLYAETSSSGEPSVGTSGASQGYIYTNSLELSNVDLAAEFVDLITIQNGYSASSKVITTTDEMLQEVISLIR
ncbi:flagellar hook protein FlgE [Desulfuromusa kysingii]|uniref:Flagellar hook protein FlgE n=1 Tax=Desulfuromusa kysingii TaxID=37625 RepID=A0A1H3VYL8_9BACT|nr:flagellar hook protein FlgE [Desulfuromusa kysingii]SDZ79975.1 flagellar hook protein FlgE [Desulfuromusa kysingii]